MSRKRLHTQADENKEWYERREREREVARQISDLQRMRQRPSGFRILATGEEI